MGAPVADSDRTWTARIGAATSVGAVVVSALLGCGPPAGAAAPDRVAAPDQVTDHAAGSQIAAHEGGRGARAPEPAPDAPDRVLGMDVSSHQGNVDWAAAFGNGARFAYVKATEGTDYANPYFGQQYDGAYGAGMVRGAYHFALPDKSDGATQANWFVDHGGGWSRDGRTLPPALDVEYNPYGEVCYGMAGAPLVAWVRAFSDRVAARTGRAPTIYTSTDWWSRCTGNAADFGRSNPLWVARYDDAVGPLPAGWGYQTFWQFANKGALPGDQNYFNGSADQLRRLATG